MFAAAELPNTNMSNKIESEPMTYQPMNHNGYKATPIANGICAKVKPSPMSPAIRNIKIVMDGPTSPKSAHSTDLFTVRLRFVVALAVDKMRTSLNQDVH